MGKSQVRYPSEFCNSVFSLKTFVALRTKGARHMKGRRPMVRAPSLEPRQRLFDLVMDHLARKCLQAGIRFELDVPKMVVRLEKRPMWPSLAWDWVLNDFVSEHQDVLKADRKLYVALAFARGKVAAMYEHETKSFATKVQAKARTAEMKRQFETERSENRGDAEFFSSNSWQRVRYEVLSESDGCCVLCGRSYREHGVALEVDHIKPRSRYPNLALERTNLQVLCFDCNRGKGNRDTTDWRPSLELVEP